MAAVRTSFAVLITGIWALFAPFASPAYAQEERYRVPSAEIVDILDAPPLPDLNVSPTGEWAVLVERPGMLTLEQIAEPRLHLAGYRLNPRTNGPAASNRAKSKALEMVNMRDGQRIQVDLPADARLSHISWSPDGRRLSFTHTHADGYDLWSVVAGDRQAARVTEGRLNAAHGAPCRWVGDGSEEMICRFVEEDRGPAPERPPVPEGPNIQVSSGEPAPARTFQDLLKDPHDGNLFEHYYTSQLAYVTVADGRVAPVGVPAIIDDFQPSPDGRFVFVSRTVRPFSYVVPDRWRINDWFPREMEVLDRQGTVVRSVASLPLEENVPVDGVRSGPRGLQWQPGEDAALMWVEAVDPRDEALPERLIRLTDFDGEPQAIFELQDLYHRMAWTPEGVGLITEVDRYPIRAASWTRTWVVAPDDPDAPPRTIFDRSAEDRFDHPGDPIAEGGTLISDGDWILLQGAGASPEGQRPFLDRLNIQTNETERIWQSDPTRLEVPVAVVRSDASELVIRSESPTDPPNFFRVAGNSSTALTDYQDPAPQLQGVERHVLTYAREDGVRLAGVVYTPPGWDGETRLPTVLWAYPREFVDPEAAAQVPEQDNSFTRISGASHMFFLLEGYAIFDGPSMAILGGLTANDTYIEQLISSTEAAVDAIVDAGIADRDRIGVGGHSYGGFMTANLLAHSDFFRAGIARSAAHNRTLTPIGFQNERRTIWDDTDVYINMSPFLSAHRIEAPMLLIHGAEDANPGTFPVQSERMFHAMKGLGKVSRLVMLNYEDHGYGARESIFHTIDEMIDWFDTHVKNAPQAAESDD